MTAESPSRLIPVTLLTGFPGKGKTTALNHLVRQPQLADALPLTRVDLVSDEQCHALLRRQDGIHSAAPRRELVERTVESLWQALPQVGEPIA